jgi:hypothetical protein
MSVRTSSAHSAVFAKNSDFFDDAHPPNDCDSLDSPTRPSAAITSDEMQRIQRRLDGFNWKKSRAWRHLCMQFGPKLNQDELVSIAELIGAHAGIRPDRDAQRRKVVMLKWFEEHWGLILPLIGFVVLE